MVLEWAIPIGIVVLVFALGFRVIRPVEEGLIETLGRKPEKSTKHGFKWIIPFIQRMYRINITERMVDIRESSMITKDNLNVSVDAVVYFKVEDTMKALYNADDFRDQIVSLCQTTARNIVGSMKFVELNSERDALNKQLAKALREEATKWGIQIVRVEVQELRPPQDVQATMNSILKADNKKVESRDLAEAEKIEAEGKKWAAIQVAEGKKEAEILEAEGRGQAIERIASADAERIRLVNESAQKHFKNAAVDLKKLETAENALRSGTKYILDTEKDVQLVLSDIAGITPVKSQPKKARKKQ